MLNGFIDLGNGMFEVKKTVYQPKMFNCEILINKKLNLRFTIKEKEREKVEEKYFYEIAKLKDILEKNYIYSILPKNNIWELSFDRLHYDINNLNEIINKIKKILESEGCNVLEEERVVNILEEDSFYVKIENSIILLIKENRISDVKEIVEKHKVNLTNYHYLLLKVAIEKENKELILYFYQKIKKLLINDNYDLYKEIEKKYILKDKINNF